MGTSAHNPGKNNLPFTNVQVLAGGVQAWIEAGLPVAQNGAY